MQSLTLFSAPESANASSQQDIIQGGVSSLNDFLVRYDHDESDIKDIYSTVGISRSEIAAAHPGTITAAHNTYIMSRYGQLAASQDEISMTYQRSAGGTGIRYFSPLADISDTSQAFPGWIGQSAAVGWFAIIQSNGSLATHGIPNTFDPNASNASSATQIVSAENLTRNAPAETAAVQPGDKLSYTLRLSNTRHVTVTGNFSLRVGDILEYTNLIDGGGGTYSQDSSTLTWPTVQLAPGEVQERTFVVQVMDQIPATGTGTSNPESYDCKLTTSFGNVLTIPVDCPAAKGIESIMTQMPHVGITGNLIFISVILLVVIFFALRSRQLKKEIRIIRHNFNTGII